MDHIATKVEQTVRHLCERTHVSHDLLALYSSRTLMRIALGALGVFLPIFFYKAYLYDLQVVIAIYLSIFGLYMLLIPLTSRLLGVLGTRPMLALGIACATAALGALYYFSSNPLYATIAYIIFASAYYSCYWVPYHVDFAHALDARMRGRQLAILRNVASVTLIAVPVIGGIIITTSGFTMVFAFSIVVMVFSLWPLWYMHNSYEHYSWSYTETFRHVFSYKNRALFTANVANGAQGVALTIFWPIYVFTLLNERYVALGVIVSLSVVIIIILRSVTGKWFDTWSPRRVLILGVVMATTGWVSKLFVQTPFEIFTADSYHKFGQTVNRLSFDATTYEQSADNGRYIDEYTALKEISLNIGRILMLLLVSILLSFFDLRVSFIIAAGASLFMVMLNRAARLR